MPVKRGAAPAGLFFDRGPPLHEHPTAGVTRRTPSPQDALSTKELPDSAPRGGGPPSAPAPRVAPDGPVPVLALPGFTLFPGTLVPLHVHEPEPCRVVAESLARDRLLVLAALAEPGPDRPLHEVAGLGRIVSDRRYPDGRMDAFVHGIERVQLRRVSLGAAGLAAELELLADLPAHDVACAGLRLFGIASSLQRALDRSRPEEAEALRALLGSTGDLGLVVNRIAAAFVEPFAERQRLLEERCPAARCDHLAARLGELLLWSAPVPTGPLH